MLCFCGKWIAACTFLFGALVSSCSPRHGWQVSYQPLQLTATEVPAGTSCVQPFAHPLIDSAAATARIAPIKQTAPPRESLCCSIQGAGYRLYLCRTQSGYQAWITACRPARFASHFVPVYVVPGYSMAQFLSETTENQRKKIFLFVGSTQTSAALHRGFPRGTYVQIGRRVAPKPIAPWMLAQALFEESLLTTASLLPDRPLFPTAPLQLHSVEALQASSCHAPMRADFPADGTWVSHDPSAAAMLCTQSRCSAGPPSASAGSSKGSLLHNALVQIQPTHVSREGHRVTFGSTASGRWYATVDECAPTGFRRTLHQVRVCCAPGYSVETLPTYDAAATQRLLRATLPHSGRAAWVYIGPWGLLGGTKPAQLPEKDDTSLGIQTQSFSTHLKKRAAAGARDWFADSSAQPTKSFNNTAATGGRCKTIRALSISHKSHKRRRRSDTDNSDDEKQLNKDSKLIDAIVSKNGSTESQRMAAIEKALKDGANVNFQDGNRKDNTPLHLAVKTGQLKVVELLLKQKNITIDAANKNGKTPLALAKKLGAQEIVDLLEGQGQFTLDKAASEDRPKEAIRPAGANAQSRVEVASPQLKRTHSTLDFAAAPPPSKRKKTSAATSNYAAQAQESILPPFSGQLKVDTKLQIRPKNFKPSIQALLKNPTPLISSSILKTVPSYPTPYLLAQFACKAYTDYEEQEFARDYEKRLSLPAGWKLLTTASNRDANNGYFGAAYWHPERRQVVLAHRGTKLTALGADWTDVKGVLFNQYVAQMNSAATFVDGIVATLKEITQEKKVHFQLFFTGHSLGGWLAQIATFTTEFLKKVEKQGGACFLKSHEPPAYHAHAVVFDSPGAEAMLLQMKDKLDVRHKGHSIDLQTLDITSYLSAPNRINTCNRHLGTLYRIFVDVSRMSWGEQKSVAYNLATHRMDKILEVFDPTTGEVGRDGQGRLKIQEIVDWPIATGLSGETEWKTFFRWANHLNDYHPEITDEKFLVHGYHPLRYQTKPYSEKTISLNVFTQEERQFLERYRWLQQLPEFFKPETLFSNLSGVHPDEVVRQLSQFNLDNGRMTDASATAIRRFIPYVKALIKLAPDLLEKTQAALQDASIRKRVYQFETQACIKEIEANLLDTNQDILGVEQFLRHAEEQVWQLKPAHTQLGLTALYRCWQKNPTYAQYQPSKGYTLTLLKTKRLLTIHQQIRLTELFNGDEIQSHLLIAAEDDHALPNPEEVQKLFDELLPILNRKRGIKIIFIHKKGTAFAERFAQKAQAQLGKHFISTEMLPLSWDVLTSEAREGLLGKTVIFQGEEVVLNQLMRVDSASAKQLPLAQLLDGALLDIGQRPPHASGYDTDFYIGRTFKRTTQPASAPRYLSSMHTPTTSVFLSENQLLDQNAPCILIADSAGMGKTTVLTHLSQQIKARNPSDWVVRIDLNDHTTALDGIDVNTSPADFVGQVLLKIKEKSLEGQLFKQLFQEQRVVLLLDGFDEISPAYKSKAIALLGQLKKSTLKQLWITTRPHLKEDLEKVLDQTAYILEPFSEENQIDFLVNYWRHKNQALQGDHAAEKEAIEQKLRNYAGQLTNKLADSVNDRKKTFTGIPLQTQLLADAFKEELAMHYQADKTMPPLPEKLDLLDLYEKFLKEQYKIFGAKGLLAKEQQATISLEGVNLPKNHQRLALQLLLSEAKFSSLHLKPLKKALKKEDLARIGIASLNEENKPQFIHRTFAEYFTAKFFVERLKDEQKAINPLLQKFFLEEILLQEEFQVVRAFINGFWKKEAYFPKETILKSYGQQVAQAWQKRGDKSADGTILYRVIREDNGQIIAFLQKGLTEQAAIAKEFLLAKDNYGQTAWQRATYWGEFEVLDKLWSWGQELLTPEERKKNWLLAKDNYGKTVWCQAAAKGSVGVLAKLWALGKKELSPDELKNKWLLAKDNYGKTAWHVLAFWGRVEGLKQLWAWAKERLTPEECKKNLLLATDNYGQTAWHLAAFWGRIEELEQLWSWDQEVKLSPDELKNNWLLAKDNDGKTAWHRAAESGKIQVLDKLWAWARELLSAQELKDKLLLAADNHGKTAWHRAAYGGKVEVVEKLWEVTPSALKKALLLTKENDGKTVWHGVAESAKVRVLDQLWDWGQATLTPEERKKIWLLATDHQGQTAWHGAAEKGKVAVLEKIWDWGQATLTPEERKKNWLLATDHQGQTAWHGAAEKGKVAVLEKIWDWGRATLTPEERKKNWLLATDHQGQTALELFQSNKWLGKEKKNRAKNLINSYLKEVEATLHNPVEALEALTQHWAALGAQSRCSFSQRRKIRSLRPCGMENERGQVFPYAPWVDRASSAVQQAGHAYRLLALSVAWQQEDEEAADVEEGMRHLGDILAAGMENQSQREHLILLEQAQQAIHFFTQNPKEELLEPRNGAVAPGIGRSVLLEHGQHWLLLFDEGERYRVYSPNLNYRHSFTTRAGVGWQAVTDFAQAFFRWKSGRGTYRDWAVKTPLPKEAIRALRASSLWEPHSIAPDRALLEGRDDLLEGLPRSALRKLFRVQGQLPELTALSQSLFRQPKDLTLSMENLHTVLLELNARERYALGRLIHRYAIAADPHWIQGLAPTERPLWKAYQQKVLQRLHQGEEVTPEELSQLSWQIFQEAFDAYGAFAPELKKKVVENIQNLQQEAGKSVWIKGMATQTLFFLPDVLRAANSGNVSSLATAAGISASDGTINGLYRRLLERLAPILSESRLGLLQKLPVTSPVFKGLTLYSIVELTQQLHALPPHAEQRSAIQHCLSEQYATVGIMAAELLGFEATPLWLGLVTEQLIFEALHFRKTYHLDLPFWEAFLMSVGFEHRKLQHIVDERQLVEANLALVEQLNRRPMPHYGWVLIKIPRLHDAHWRTVPEAQIPQAIRQSVVQQPEAATSTKRKAIQENGSYRFVRNHQTHTAAVGHAARTVRGQLLHQSWQRKYFNISVQSVTFDLSPGSSGYQEASVFLEQPETEGLKHYQRVGTVTTPKSHRYVENPPVQIAGPGLGALYINRNQSQPYDGQGRNLYHAFDPKEGDTTLRVTASGLQALTSRYQRDHPTAHNTGNTAYHITVQIAHKTYPDQISAPATQQPAIWLLDDLHQQLNSHYWIGTLQRPFSIQDNCPTNQLAFSTEPGYGYRLQSQGHERIQLHPLAAHLPDHTLWLKGTKRYLALQLKGQQIQQLTLHAQQVDLLDVSGTPPLGEVHLGAHVQRFTLTIAGAIVVRDSNAITLEVKGQIAQGETPMHYRKASGLQRPAHYALVVSDLQPLLSTIKQVGDRHITWSSPGLTNRWEAPWHRREETFLHIRAATHPNCSLLLSRATLTLVQPNNAGEPTMALVDHAQPVAQLEAHGRLQRVIAATEREWFGNLTPEAVTFAKSWDDGIVLQWLTPTGTQQWHHFLGEKVTLNGIHYQVHQGQLDAIGSEDNVIRGERLLTTLRGAPLAIRVNQSLVESQLRWGKGTLTLNNLTLSHLPTHTHLYFNQQGFTWATLQETFRSVRPQRRRQRSPPTASAAPATSGSVQAGFWLGHLVQKAAAALPSLWQWTSPSIASCTRTHSAQEMPTAGWEAAFNPEAGPGPTADATPTLIACGDRWLQQPLIDGLLVWSDFFGRSYQRYKRKPRRTNRKKKSTAPSMPRPVAAEVALHTEEMVQAFLSHLQTTATACGLTKTAAQQLVETIGVSAHLRARLRQQVARGELSDIPKHCYQAVAQQYKEIQALSSAAQATTLVEKLKTSPAAWAGACI